VLIVLILFLIVFLVLPIGYLAFRMRNEEFVAGGSFGRQITGRNKDEMDEN